MWRFSFFLALAGGLWMTSCLGLSSSLDALGREEAVTETKKNAATIADDRIKDKHPVYDPARTVDEVFERYCVVRLNKSGSVTKLDIAKPSKDEADLVDKIFPSRSAAALAVKGRLDDEHSLIPSIEVVNGALKPFNDGLYAAVETGVALGLSYETGAEIYPSKRRFLHDLLAGVLAMREAYGGDPAFFDAAATDLGAALMLAGETPTLPETFTANAATLVSAFEAEPIFSRPIGFYTWTPTLGQVFRLDRFLQNYQAEETPYTDAEFGKAAVLALAIDADAALRKRYDGYLALYAGLTNPFVNHEVTALLPYLADGTASLSSISSVSAAFLADYPPPELLPECQPHFALFPSSESKETTFFESRYCTGAPPSSINYMDALIAAIREGLVDLTPDAGSGWYDYQSHALEVLLLPERGSESDHLLLTAAYKKKLIETFKSLITQNRETHVKQLEMGSSKGGVDMSMPMDIYPNFPVEPFPTFYLRSARAYRFLGTYLQAVLGEAFLAGTYRMYEDGTVSETTLADELVAKAELLYGLHFLTADAVGMAPELLAEELGEYAEEACRTRARAWTADWLLDSDVVRDSRVIMPVQRELDETIYWATLGTRVIRATAEFVPGFEPEIVPIAYDELPADLPEGTGYICDVDKIIAHDYYLLVDTFAEVRLSATTPPPTRDELRALLDPYDNVADMVSALESL